LKWFRNWPPGEKSGRASTEQFQTQRDTDEVSLESENNK
jgi:hypothetical protein